MAKVKRRASHEAGTREYAVKCGDKLVFEAWIYPNPEVGRGRRHKGHKSYCLQMYSKRNDIDEVMCNMDSYSDARERLLREAREIECRRGEWK